MFVGTRAGMTRSNWTGWQDQATTSQSLLLEWLKDGYSLVTVAKRGHSFAFDLDDPAECERRGFKREWLEGYYAVDTPSGGEHHHGLHDASTEGLGNLINVYRVKGDKGSGKILELKLHNQSVAAPTAKRIGQEKKRDGVYKPRMLSSKLKRGIHPELLAWLKEWGEMTKPRENSGAASGRIEFHHDFGLGDFLDHNGCAEQHSGMVDGALHVEVEACPHCDKESPKSTIRAAIAKFIFGGNGYGFVCHACGINTREEHEQKMQEEHEGWEPWQGYIYRDDDPEWLFNDPKFPVEAVQDDGKTPTMRQPDFLNGECAQHSPVATPRQAFAVPEFMDVGDESDIKCTDVGNGKRLGRLCGYEIAFVVETGNWHVWNGKYWVEDRANIEITRKAKEVAKTIFMEAAAEPDDKKSEALAKWAIQSQSKTRIEAMVAMAKSEGTIAKSITEFDKDAHLYNCQNGVIDLRTGELLPHDPRYLMSQISPFKYLGLDAGPKLFDSYLSRVQPDPEIRAFLQRGCGYSMWGTSREHAILFLWGVGNNGKGVLLFVMNRVLGGYCAPAEFKTFSDMGRSGGPGGHSDDIAHLANKRCVYVDETNAGGRLNEGLVKTITGGGRQHASFKGKTGFDFDPIFTFWFASNHKPKLTDTGRSMRRRIKFVRFDVAVPDEEVDTGLPDKLVAEEGDAILSWMVKGAVEWHQKGLAAPDKVENWTDEYFRDEDIIQHWIDECIETGTGYESPAKDTYLSFMRFAEENNYWKMDAREFKKRLEQKGFAQKPKKDRNYWLGFRVTKHFFDEPEVTDEMMQAIQ